MFKQETISQEILKKRNCLLHFVRWTLVLITLVLTVWFLLGQVNEVMSIWGMFLPLLALLFYFRFEIWSSPYFAEEYHRHGQAWVVNGLKDTPAAQTKFFTGKKHQAKDKNPLW